jgi:hypothetical protein
VKSARRHYAVDQIENDLAILLDDEGTGYAVPVTTLPLALREGMVLGVMSDREGRPDWSTAVHDETEERWRLEEAAERLERLKQQDPGGDLEI